APSAAVALAEKIFGALAGRSALILGAGDVAELAAGCLAAEGVQVALVASRTYERARVIAERLGGYAMTLEEAWDHFATADIVLCSTAAPHAVVTWERVAPAIRRRGGRPLCLLDLAVPRDVEPAVAQLENVFLYDIDDLQAVAAQATAQRRGEIPAAERIVSEEVDRFWGWYDGLGVVPVIRAFRDRLDDLRRAELERALRRRGNLPRGVRFVLADIRSAEARDLVAQGRFDLLNHHAAQMDVRRSVADPLFDLDVNLRGLLNLLEGARAGGVRRVVFASSGGV